MEQKGIFGKIATKVLGPIGIIIIFMVVTMIVSITKVTNIQQKLDILQNETEVASDLVEDTRYNVLHTAEILTDVSATHDDAGLKEAAEFKENVHSNIEKLKEIDKENAATWDEALKQYDEFYELCVKMANTYITSGLEAGNQVMEQVDPLTDKVSETMDSNAEAIEERLESEIQKVSSEAKVMLWISIITSVLNLFIAVVIGFLVLLQVINPIKSASSTIKKLAERDLTIPDLKAKQRDEIGDLISSINVLKESMREIMANMDGSTENLEEVSTVIAGQSDTIHKNVSEITEAINNVAEITTEQATDIESSMNEIVELQDIAIRNAGTSDHLSDASEQISIASQKGTEVLDELYKVTKESEVAFGQIFDSIEKIKNSTMKIGEASNMIQSIAAQTNLLSLNASIEAARAGEMGKGFAVVAHEIRKLSDESTESVEEINKMLQELQVNVDNANRQSENVKEAVSRQVQGVEDTRGRYEDISSNLHVIDEEIKSLAKVSKSMTDSCNHVSDAMEHLSNSAQGNAAATEETSASIQEVMAMVENITKGTSDIKVLSDDLSDIVNKYQL